MVDLILLPDEDTESDGGIHAGLTLSRDRPCTCRLKLLCDSPMRRGGAWPVGILRKATYVSIGLSLLGAVLDRNSEDSSVETAAEVAMLAKMIGGSAAPAQPGQASKDQDRPAGLLSLLGR